MTTPRSAVYPDDLRKWDLAALAGALGFSAISDLNAALGSVDKLGYVLFALTDDDGKRRVISAPKPWLKALQRKAYRSVIMRIPISGFVHSCHGRGVITNAKQHVGNAYMTVMDVAGCYPSTTSRAVQKSFENAGVRAGVAGALTRLTTLHGFLPQGAPTSSSVLDVIFRPIDEALNQVALAYDAIFTRYVDDLAFSSVHSLAGLPREVSLLLRDFGYRSNPSKCRVWGPSNPHTVTGIVVTSTLTTSREFLGALSEHLTRLKHGNCRLTESQIRNKINWVSSLDPVRGRSLLRRLGRNSRPPGHSMPPLA